jgi:DNA-binding LytR/AlgR family response regulator
MSAKLSCYIIDDEPLARTILEEYVAKVPFLEWKGSFSGALEASARMDQDKPDVLFLDINMPDVDGIRFISMLKPRPIIILTTAYDQYALKAFDLAVNDYLLKPISFDRFYEGVLRVFRGSERSLPADVATSPIKKDPEHLFVKAGFRIQKIALREILFIEGMKDYLRIHTASDKIMTLMSFSKLQELLPASRFARVHRSFMVALEKIEHIERNRIRIKGQDIPISETYAAEFYKNLNGTDL